jgi:CRISPR system Cascade subunit CasB
LVTSETTKPWERQAQAFVAALERLDAGGRARLKRNAGRTLAEARDIHRVFFQALPYEVREHEQEDYFLIATLFPLVAHHAQAGSLGATLRQVHHLRGAPHANRENHQVSSLERRFQTLLDSDREQLPFRLRQAVRLIAAHRDEARLNWEQLLRDVRQWEHPERFVQLRWARDYFVGSVSDVKNDTELTHEGGHS